MELYGEIVTHKTFGKGRIVAFDNKYITVLFDESQAEKKFAYPSAFGLFLELENQSLLPQIDEDKNIITRKEAELKRLEEERKKADIAAQIEVERLKIANSPAGRSLNNNIAFKCNYCDGGKSETVVGYKGVCSDETIKYNIKTAKHIWCSQPKNMCYQYLHGDISRADIDTFYEQTKAQFSESVCYESQMLEIWIAGAGITQNGTGKGRPMAMRNIKANSLAILTSKLPKADETERFIFAVFLIDENYEGDNSEEGHVGANPTFRIMLSPDQAMKLKFWDYYYNENNPEKIVFGSGLHRYISDIQAAQMLKDLYAIKKDTAEESLAKEFLDHYARIKKLDLSNIPPANGALQRILRSCPACGSMESLEIFYGYPTNEILEAVKQGELILGGSSSTLTDPTRHCNTCGQDFGGDSFFPLADLDSFEFSMGGFFGTSHAVYLDGTKKTKTIQYATAPQGMTVDLTQPKATHPPDPDRVYQEITLTPKKWLALADALTALEIPNWGDTYADNDISDGTQWELQITFPDGRTIHKSGSNDYPPAWDKFIKILKKYVNKNIE